MTRAAEWPSAEQRVNSYMSSVLSPKSSHGGCQRDQSHRVSGSKRIWRLTVRLTNCSKKETTVERKLPVAWKLEPWRRRKESSAVWHSDRSCVGGHAPLTKRRRSKQSRAAAVPFRSSPLSSQFRLPFCLQFAFPLRIFSPVFF